MRRLIVFLSILLVFLVACSTRTRPEIVSDPESGIAPLVPTPTFGGIPADSFPGDDLPADAPGVDIGSSINAPYLGIHIDDHTAPEQLAYFISSGASLSRFDRFYWDLIEPVPQTPAIYDWSSVDEASLINVSEIGIDFIGIILFAPPYAQKYPGSVCGPIAEDQLERFGQFLYTLVSRYSQPPYNIKYWEIGNEPDIDYAFVNRYGFGCWGDPNDTYYGGGYYAYMLKHAYPMIKAADPQAQVLIGGLLLDCDPRNPVETSPGSGILKNCSSSLFLEGILENGGGEFFDGISFHAYDYYSFEEGKYSNQNWLSASDTNGSVAIHKARYLRERLAAHGLDSKYIMNTESALICGSDGKDPGCQAGEFARTKAAYTVHTNTIAFQLGLRANIWYSLMGWRASELLDTGYTPLPAYEAYRFNTSVLGNASFTREVLDYPNMFIYEFETPMGTLWIIWSRSGRTESIFLPSNPNDAYDIYGNRIPAIQEISTNYSPIYIVFTR
jgi:hypothetical protein